MPKQKMPSHKKDRDTKNLSAPPAGTGAADPVSSPFRALDRYPRMVIVGVFIWAVLIESMFVFSNVDAHLPVGVFFIGDSPKYFEQAQDMVVGEPYNDGLPFHPPLLPWSLSLLWLILPSSKSVFIAGKLFMIILSSLGVTLLYGRFRFMFEAALPAALLLPFAFQELILVSAVNTEMVYRFLLILMIMAWPSPVLLGLLNALACLTRPEHLPLSILILILAALHPRWRKQALRIVLTTVILLLPVIILNAIRIHHYNQAQAALLPHPLPVICPITISGPLNFALAQTSENIYFGASQLEDISRTGKLDPRVPQHNDYLLNGYRIGLTRIAAHPGSFLLRSAQKILFSLRSLISGFTWRDIPKPAVWVRQPIDMALSSAPIWEVISLILILVGIWSLRGRPIVLIIPAVFLITRLLTNVVFFPFARSMAIVLPFIILLQTTGLLSGIPRRFWRHATALLVFSLLLLQLYGTVFMRDYALKGALNSQGRILDDSAVMIQLTGVKPR